MTDDALPSSRLPDVIGGRYRIVSRLGVGGMGVVYKAIDQQLNRPVAVKAVEDRRLLMPGSSGRLRTEALAAASLDHPYICKVYELVETPTEAFIVMEFVEGETLSSILKRGVPPLLQSLLICREVAEGLAEAHAHGLVHRDVKPANVMVTPSGHVKLLDFGVAGADVTLPAADHTRTHAPQLTVHAGTPQYMAPEQASGQPITARADLFSLGVMLYECISGALPFSGSTTFDYVRHVMQSPPRRLDRVAPETPADLVELVERCLEKTPADRPASADDVVAELRRLSAALASPGAAVRTAGQARAGRRWKVVAAVAIAMSIVAVSWRYFWRSTTEPVRWQSRSFVTSAGLDFNSRISPDGQWVSFISTNGGASQVMLQRVDGGEARPMTLGQGTPVSQLWSPDGKEVACVLRLENSWMLQIYPAFFGGEPRQTVKLGTRLSQVDLLRWIDRTMYVAIHDPDISLRTVDADTLGSMANLSDSWKLPGVQIQDGKPRSSLRDVDVRPDGRGVALTLLVNGQTDLWTANLDGSGLQALTNDAFFDRDPVWNGRGDRILFNSNRGGPADLWEIDPRTKAMTQLNSGDGDKTPDSSSVDGSLLSYEFVSQAARLWLWNPATGNNQQLTQDARRDYAPALAANGRVVAFQRSLPTPTAGASILDAEIFTAPFDGQRLTEDARPIGEGYVPAVSADGAWIAYLLRAKPPGMMALSVRNRASGATLAVSQAVPLPISFHSPVEWASNSMTWNPAGTELFFVERVDATIAIRRFRTGETAPGPPLVTMTAVETLIRDLYVSADNRRLGYVTSSREALVVHSLDVDTGVDRELARLPASITGTYGRGWMGDEFVVIQRQVLHDDLTADLTVLVIGTSGQVRKAGSIPTAFIATPRLHPERRVLYVTRLDRGVQNVYEFALATGALKPLTQNVLSGVTFSGFCPAGPDRLLGVREERRQDIYLIQQSRTKAAGNSAGR